MSFADTVQKNKKNESDAATKFFTETKPATAPETKAKQKKNCRVSVILNESLFEKLNQVTAAKGVSKNAYIIMALSEYLKNE